MAMAMASIAPTSSSSSSSLFLHPHATADAARRSKGPLQVTSSCTCSNVSVDASSRSHDPLLSQRHSHPISRRRFSIPLPLGLATLLILESQGRAGDACADVIKNENNADANNGFRGLESFFDATEVTKSGKTLPKSYVQSAREVVRALRESLKEDSKDEEKFRRSGDSAKEAIRVYLSSWRGSKELAAQDSFQALARVLRVLGQFYITSGPRAALPEDVKATILEDLNKADEAL